MKPAAVLWEDYRMVTRRDALLAGLAAAPVLQSQSPGEPDLGVFFGLLNPNAAEAKAAQKSLEAGWRDSYAILLLEMLRLVVREPARTRLLETLAQRTRQKFGPDLKAWTRWAWSLEYAPHSHYAEFKGMLYANIDGRLKDFFPPGVKSLVRLDEVEWGGVPVNGIPPLVQPVTIAAREAAYLKDSHIVFGVERNGEAKAYPKRILAWHEMALDRVGGVDLTIVYCTLCGTVIPYRSVVNGRKITFGTSGLLYQSSKLMFDEETHSLWSTLQGKPMIGVLAGSDLELEFVPVVTTAWGEWRQSFPRSLVLSPETGHQRDYSEGAAYRDYFSHDDLMFEVSRRDRRLKNKDEVLVVRLKGKRPLAVSAKWLERRPVNELEHDGAKLTIRTERGANRVFVDGKQIPAHRAFWFGWYAQYPDTVLIR